MPAAPKTSAADLVAFALALLERGGEGAVTMQAVAAAAGIKGPSLYKRYPTRDLLLDDVAREGLFDLDQRLAAARKKPQPLEAMARAYRAFALERPHLYALLFAARPEGGDLVARRAETVRPLLDALSGRVGARDALAAARLLTAWLHGFVSMELAGAFRLGGRPADDFEWGLGRVLRSL
jgi:AcrR family transcriptional regulator